MPQPSDAHQKLKAEGIGTYLMQSGILQRPSRKTAPRFARIAVFGFTLERACQALKNSHGINLLLTICAAYPLSMPDLKGKNFVTFLITFTMFFSGGMIPSYLSKEMVEFTK